MPRYFFNVAHGGHVQKDAVGAEFSDERAALEEARLVAGELLRDAAFRQRPLDHLIEVCDSAGNVVIAFQCSDARILGSAGPGLSGPRRT